MVCKSPIFYEQLDFLFYTICLGSHSFLYRGVLTDKGTEMLPEAINVPFVTTFKMNFSNVALNGSIYFRFGMSLLLEMLSLNLRCTFLLFKN